MRTNIIDFHTHAFPDAIAERAVSQLAAKSGPYRPQTNGTINGLLDKMNENGVATAIVANIATKKAQINSILKWSASIASDRIVPLASFYPDKNDWEGDLNLIVESGLKGIKLHPLYQNFMIDDETLFPIYEFISSTNLFILFHSGFDVGFPRSYTNAQSIRLKKLIDNFPKLRVIASHVGGWDEWDSVLELIAGRDVFIEMSFVHEVDPNILKQIFNKHDSNKFLFGSDTPWLSHRTLIDCIESLDISEDFKDKIFYRNAKELLLMH